MRTRHQLREVSLLHVWRVNFVFLWEWAMVLEGEGGDASTNHVLGVFPSLFLRLFNLTAVWNYSQSDFQAYRNVDFLPPACLLVPLLVLVFNVKLILIQRIYFKSTVGLYTSYCTCGGKIYIETTNLILQGLMYRPYNILLLILFHYYCLHLY